MPITTRSQGLGEDGPTPATGRQQVDAIPPRVFEEPPQSPSEAAASMFQSANAAVTAPLTSVVGTRPAARRAGSSRAHSHVSSSSAAARARLEYESELELANVRRRQLDAEARRSQLQAEIERKQLDLEAALICKKLAADVAQLEADASESGSRRDPNESSAKVAEWLDHDQARALSPGRPPVVISRDPRDVRREEGGAPPRNYATHETERREHSFGFDHRQRSLSPPPRRSTGGHERQRSSSPPRRSRDRGVDRLVNVLEQIAMTRPPPRQALELPAFTGAYNEWLPYQQAMIDSTRTFKLTDAENMARLRVSLKGDAKETVSALLYTARSPDVVMNALGRCYGRPEIILDRTVAEIQRLPRLGGTSTELNNFAVKLQNIVCVIESLDRKEYSRNPMLVRNVVQKFDSHLKARWTDYAKIHCNELEPKIVTMSRFMNREADQAYEYACENELPASTVAREVKQRTPPARRTGGAPAPRARGKPIYATTTAVEKEEKKPACLCCGGGHSVPQCKKFIAMNVGDRWNWAKEARVCFRCLIEKHRRFACKARSCVLEGCDRTHHALLHTVREPTREPEPEPVETVLTSVVAKENRGSVLLKVCPVDVVGPLGERVSTYALLDEGATVTLIEADLANRIGADGPKRGLKIHGVGSSRSEPRSRVVEINIRGRTGASHAISARTVNNLTLSRQSIDSSCLEYAHLRGLDRSNVCYTNVQPGILVGADNWHLIVTRQLLIGGRREPAASLTELGWTIHGTVPRACRTNMYTETVLHAYTHGGLDERLEEQVKRHFEIDSVGISKVTKPSRSEQRALDTFLRTAKRVGDHFEVGLPWKEDAVTMPPSFDMAFRRLRAIERKMDASSEFKREYKAQIQNLLDKGYAELCEAKDVDSPIGWYLPHFAVRNVNKPEKLRLVHDAAATVNGISLNDKLLDGPDLLRSLPGVLYRFRERDVAVSADIREMFMRIKIRKADQPAQMFLWRGDDRMKPPNRYKMTSMIFGARSSPFLAHSVRNLNAREHAEFYPVAADAITSNHYMDDWVDSFETESQATRAVAEVVTVHARAGFQLAGWNSNSSRVLEHVPAESRARAAKELGGNDPHETGKTLGLLWEAGDDELRFNTSMNRVPRDVLSIQRGPTKREALSAVMSIFDPLGLLSYFTVRAKIILQNVWRLNIGWDEALPDKESREFTEWLRDLTSIADLRLDRRYGFDKNVINTQLHVYNDASEVAYATAAYWRIQYRDGSVRVTLAAAKARVTPIRAPSIPRTELQANLIGARLADSILREHRVKVDRVVFWSDSKTALHWIRNDKPRYTPYVAHRLSEISELTRVDQWRWVPTAHNVADDATRSSTGTKDRRDRWFIGPSYLYESEAFWPIEDETPVTTEEEVVVSYASEKVVSDHLPDISRFSDYERLIRTTARVLAFVDICRKRANRVELGHVENAEKLWLIKSQRDEFADEYECLKRGKQVPRSSRLYKVDPVLGQDGIIRVNGRINAARIEEIENSPTVLDGRNAFTRLLIANTHRRAGHGGRERVTNDVRQKFFVLRLRPTVRTMLRECSLCKVRKATPFVPAFGNLPAARLDAFRPPFSNCGVDYFGPMLVTIGRRREKRWGALFTCLTTRAVHIELAASLNTDSAIMTLRRMAARRGWPRVIYSDNGTNFRGADAELRAAIKEWEPGLREFALSQRIDWRYIDPGAPNQGGSWERLVRSIKTALSVTLNDRAPREEVLSTLLAEAEYTVNARPLTHVSVDPSEPGALTPNHFLLGQPNGLPITGTCEEADRRQWRAAQALADTFWYRWVREYLPQLIPRGSPTDTSRNLAVGDLVIIIDSTLPRNVWPRGQIVKIYPGPDGTVRSVDVKTKGGVFRRPVRKLAVLPIS